MATSGTGRDVTLSAPKSVSLMALVGGDERVVAAHDRAVGKTLAWVERNAIETRMQDKASGAMEERGLGGTGESPHLAARAVLMTRARKRDVDKGELRQSWERQVAELGFSAEAVRAKARQAERERPAPDLFAGAGYSAAEAASWAVAHVSEREAVFGHVDLLAATLASEPGAVTVDAPPAHHR